MRQEIVGKLATLEARVTEVKETLNARISEVKQDIHDRIGELKADSLRHTDRISSEIQQSETTIKDVLRRELKPKKRRIETTSSKAHLPRRRHGR